MSSSRRITALVVFGLALGRTAGAQPLDDPSRPQAAAKDPFLDALVSEALERNPDLLALREAALAARARPEQVQALADPMLTTTYTNDGWSPSLGSRDDDDARLHGQPGAAVRGQAAPAGGALDARRGRDRAAGRALAPRSRRRGDARLRRPRAEPRAAEARQRAGAALEADRGHGPRALRGRPGSPAGRAPGADRGDARRAAPHAAAGRGRASGRPSSIDCSTARRRLPSRPQSAWSSSPSRRAWRASSSA